MKICILILSTKNQAFDCFKNAIQSTWLADFKNKSIDCYFYEGDSKRNILIGDTIYLSVNDEIKFTFHKFYKCLEFLNSINRNYDLYFRANLSCYIDVVKFIDFIDHFNLNSYTFCGKLGMTYLMSELTLKYKLLRPYKKYFQVGTKISFYSGAGFFIGYRKVEFILKYGKLFKNIFIVDDVLIGMLLISKSFSKFKYNNLKILEVKSNSFFKLTDKELFNLINHNHLFFYRFKNDDRINDSEYILKFANQSFRDKFILNGIDNIENLDFSNNEVSIFDIYFPKSLTSKFILVYNFCHLLVSYVIIFILINYVRFNQKILKKLYL